MTNTKDIANQLAASNIKLADPPACSEDKRPTKASRLRRMLRRKGGVSIEVLQEDLGWQAHTVRAAISRLRKGGETVVCQQGKNGAVYRIVDSATSQ
jgi:biotin operon repressor